MEKQLNLFGEEIEVPVNDTSKLLTKIKKPKKVSDKTTKTKKKKEESTLEERITEVHNKVLKDLHKYKNTTEIITTKDRLYEYIKTAIELNGDIAIDTETNFSTDPLTCKIMGPCLYSEGLNSVYVPINHVDYVTGERLPNQLSEEDLNEIFKYLLDKFCIYHHGKFDYSVIKYTCGIELPISWDTMIGSQLLNENELAGLKYQYKDKIDPTEDDYHVDTYFDGSIPYEYFDPEIFALYAATDAYKTYKLYKYQKKIFEQPGNERLYKLFSDIEMPVVLVTAEMENRGLAIDEEFSKRLSDKFHIRLDEVDRQIEHELESIKPKIDKWRLTDKANDKPRSYAKEEDYYDEKLEKKYPYSDEKGRYKLGKSLSEKLSDPPEITSPTQLGILLYDILGEFKLKGDGKRTTDEATLLESDLELCRLVLKKREYEKYLGTYIDKLPECRNPRDNRIHPKFNQMGREDRNVVTGRMSSSEPNL